MIMSLVNAPLLLAKTALTSVVMKMGILPLMRVIGSL